MPNKKTTTKISKKATADIEVSKPSKRTTKKAQKEIKKMGMGTTCLAIFLLVAGVVGGFFGVKYISRQDCFEIIGQDEITLSIGEEYLDEGVKVVAFGVNDANKVKTETNLKIKNGKYYAETEGTYYIKYTVDDIKYGSIFKIQKIRLINFVEPTEAEEIGGVDE